MNTKTNDKSKISLEAKNKMNVNNMSIGNFENKFIKGLELKLKKKICRYINVDYEMKAAGLPGYCQSDKKQMTTEEIQTNRGDPYGNTLSIYLKHTDIWVVDFDTFDLEGCELYEICKKLNCPYTKTTKGYHYYIKLLNCSRFTNEIDTYKIEKGEEVSKYPIDLLHQDNNIWENRGRKNRGGDEIPELDWNEIKPLFNTKKMNFKNNIVEKVEKVVKPLKLEPVSPVFTVSSEENDAEPETKLIRNTIPIEQLRTTVLKITDKYRYDDWIMVGFAIHTASGGSVEGLALFLEWSMKDTNYKENDSALDHWNRCNKKNTNEIPYERLKIWAGEIDFDKSNIYRYIYNSRGVEAMIEHMNKELKFCVSSALYIFIDEKEKTIYEHKKNDMANHYEEFTFTIIGEEKNIVVDPFKIWCKDPRKAKIKKIIWNPDPDFTNKDYYNTFSQFDITREKVYEMYPDEDSIDYENDDEITPLLDHIKNIICKDDKEKTEYFMNWLAHIVQKPHIQTGVVIALKSVQGSGKGVLYNDFLKPILGSAASQLTKMMELTGQFNDALHKKVLINLNEAVWGGNKTDKGILKSIITEPVIKIRKLYKNAEEYTNYVNFLMDSNEDYIIPADDKERRYNLYECDNKYGNMALTNPDKIAYFDKVRSCKPDKFAKYLYSRDITTFNPRKFKKTEELQGQVEMGWSPLIEWWYKYISDEGFKTKKNFHYYGTRTMISENNVGVEFNGPKAVRKYKKKEETKNGKKGNGTKILGEDGKPILIGKEQWLYQEFFYDNFISFHINKGYKLSKKQFWLDLQEKCTGSLKLKKMKDGEGRRQVVLLPDLKVLREQFNIKQSSNYEWDDDMISDEEEEEEEDEEEDEDELDEC